MHVKGRGRRRKVEVLRSEYAQEAERMIRVLHYREVNASTNYSTVELRCQVVIASRCTYVKIALVFYRLLFS